METNKIEELFANFFNTNKESIPSWAVMLIEVLKELANQVKIVNNLVNAVQQLEDNMAVNDRISDELKNENARPRKTINNMSLEIDDQEQRSRNACLLCKPG